jgi:Ser/Thr protein kinase RdoA (MazF antagonist)
MFNVSPLPSLAEVNRLLSAWDIEAAGYEIARGGVENMCLIVDTAGNPLGRVVLRIHRPDTGARVRLELAALHHLGRLGLAVPRPLPTAAGAMINDHEGAPTSLLAYVDGVSLDRCTPAPVFARSIGTLLARVDAGLAQLPGGREAIAHDITDLASARDRLAACRRVAGFPWQRVEDALEDAARAVAAWQTLPRQVIHGDVSRGNIIYLGTLEGSRPPREGLAQAKPALAHATHGEGRFALIDFGDAGAGPRITDVAIALAQLALVSGRLRPEIWSALWAGFAEIADPSDDERAAVLPLVKLRYATLIVDHVWRELSGRHHPGHLALVALGIEGLHALASAPPTLLSLESPPLCGAA